LEFEMSHKKLSLLLVPAVLATLTTIASAQPARHRRHPLVAARYNDERPPLTVNRRSFLDPGPVVAVGSMSNYVTASTVFGQTPDQYFLKSQFGNEVLPSPLEVPGRPQPIVEFETPAYPY
jgi:hypothetical protein